MGSPPGRRATAGILPAAPRRPAAHIGRRSTVATWGLLQGDAERATAPAARRLAAARARRCAGARGPGSQVGQADGPGWPFRLPDHPAERQPGHPPSGDPDQRRPDRADRRRLPLLRGRHTPTVGRLIQAVDRGAACEPTALGVRILSGSDLGVEQGYMTESNYSTGYSKARVPGHQGTRLGWPSATQRGRRRLHHGAPPTSPGALGVPTPMMDSIIERTSSSCWPGPARGGTRTLGSLDLEAVGRAAAQPVRPARPSFLVVDFLALSGPGPP